MNTREAILTGAKAARQLHNDFDIRKRTVENAGCIDVFGSLVEMGATVLFRPLDNLLGACLSVPVFGVVITTKRPLPVQRFTGAHELGHVFMHHEGSLDGEEIINGDALNDFKEVEANAFANEFMMPRWLLAFHAKRQNWNSESIKNPHVVYQLSLRIGASYEATCISLLTHNLIDHPTLKKLSAVPRKTLKQELLGTMALDHWRRDVWLLTKNDEGAALLGQPEDLFLFRLKEESGSGYLWDIHELQQKGFTVLQDQRQSGKSSQIGEPKEREITAQSEGPSEGELLLEHRRPWQKLGAPINRLHLWYDLQGKEQGLSRAMRRHLEAA